MSNKELPVYLQEMIQALSDEIDSLEKKGNAEYRIFKGQLIKIKKIKEKRS